MLQYSKSREISTNTQRALPNTWHELTTPTELTDDCLIIEERAIFGVPLSDHPEDEESLFKAKILQFGGRT